MLVSDRSGEISHWHFTAQVISFAYMVRGIEADLSTHTLSAGWESVGNWTTKNMAIHTSRTDIKRGGKKQLWFMLHPCDVSSDNAG